MKAANLQLIKFAPTHVQTINAFILCVAGSACSCNVHSVFSRFSYRSRFLVIEQLKRLFWTKIDNVDRY